MLLNLRIGPLAYGIASYVPGLTRLLRRGTGGTGSARYCYSVWMRHLRRAWDGGFRQIPATVAELGPGDSLGAGLAALLSGSERYFACDFISYASNAENLKVLDELVTLFNSHADIPDHDEFPLVVPRLDSYRFPSDILPDTVLTRSLAPERIERIRAAVSDPSRADGMITYRAPWLAANVVQQHSVDMIFSQAVMEHIDDLHEAYETMLLWLKPSGCMTHSIDYKSHGMTNDWNGHWIQSDLAWKLLRGRRPYMINRQPHSAHLELMQQTGFRVLVSERFKKESRVERSALAGRFSSMPSDDMITSEAFILAAPQI
jgi:hypothetical protein